MIVLSMGVGRGGGREDKARPWILKLLAKKLGKYVQLDIPPIRQGDKIFQIYTCTCK